MVLHNIVDSALSSDYVSVNDPFWWVANQYMTWSRFYNMSHGWRGQSIRLPMNYQTVLSHADRRCSDTWRQCSHACRLENHRLENHRFKEAFCSRRIRTQCCVSSRPRLGVDNASDNTRNQCTAGLIRTDVLLTTLWRWFGFRWMRRNGEWYWMWIMLAQRQLQDEEERWQHQFSRSNFCMADNFRDKSTRCPTEQLDDGVKCKAL